MEKYRDSMDFLHESACHNTTGKRDYKGYWGTRYQKRFLVDKWQGLYCFWSTFPKKPLLFIFYKRGIAVKCVNQIHQALGKLSYQSTPVIHLCQPNAKILTFVSPDICLLKYTILASSRFGLKPPEMSNNISILHAYTWEPKYLLLQNFTLVWSTHFL